MGYDDLRPAHYTLRFEPNLKQATFRGVAHIHVKCNHPTNIIELDCSELTITACYVFLTNTDDKPDLTLLQDDPIYDKNIFNYINPLTSRLIKIPLSRISTHNTQERLLIRLPSGLEINTDATIRLDFDGILNDRLLGFYRSSYTDSNGITKHLATTQFEAADARRAFPCWDIPDAKATFAIQLVVYDAQHTAISNMPTSRIKRSKNNRTFYFDATPLMSTYLVYMGVGEFSFTQTTCSLRERDIKLRVITTSAIKKDLAKFALKYGQKLLELYESYFEIPYPLPKLDLIAIPDFAAGAMENWGAITFRENLLLYDKNTSSARTKQLIAEVISHELAHQWFGNLVTMKWWNDLWLNESFATFMATKLLDKMHPEWDLWKQFLTDAMNTAMALDSLQSTHPIDVPVDSPSQIREIFDPISYEKGGCVLRMLEYYVGERSFKRGLVAYLKKFKYANAKGNDLWQCIEEKSGKPVSHMIKSWLDTPGFPVVHLKIHKDALSARQEQYVLLHTDKKTTTKWIIPLSLKVLGKKKIITTILFSTRTTSIDITSTKQNTNKKLPVILANPGRTCFYRVHYDASLMSSVISFAKLTLLDASTSAQSSHSSKTLQKPSIEMPDLWALQNDLFAMCVRGYSTVNEYLQILNMYDTIDDYAILHDINMNMSRLYMLSFRLPTANHIIKKHSMNFYKRVHQTVTGWNSKSNEPHAMSLLRGPIIWSLGLLGDADVVAKSYEFYKILSENNRNGNNVHPRVLSPDVIEYVCAVAAWNCKSKSDARVMYTQLVEMHECADSTEKKMRFVSAMCKFQYTDILLRTLQYALSSNVRSQNFFLLVSRVSENPNAVDILWPWVQKNWKKISRKVGHGNPLLGRIISSLANTCCVSDIPQIQRFFKSNPTPGTERTLLQTIERIQISDNMKKRIKIEFAKDNSK